jgi:hypothetical protein
VKRSAYLWLEDLCGNNLLNKVWYTMWQTRSRMFSVELSPPNKIIWIRTYQKG